jgi:S1-C subfamily serine protease
MAAVTAAVHEDVLAKVRRSTVLLTCGNRWATGVVVSARGHIITCAHFVRDTNGAPVSVTTTSGTSFGGSILFVAAATQPWDVAVLRATAGEWDDFVDLAKVRPRAVLGEPCFVVGHHLLGPDAAKKFGPIFLRGSLAKVVETAGIPVLLLATAPSYDGASGGPVIDAHGALLGLSTSNLEGAGG